MTDMDTLFTQFKQHMLLELAHLIDREQKPSKQTLFIFGFPTNPAQLKKDQAFTFVLKDTVTYSLIRKAVEKFGMNMNGSSYSEDTTNPLSVIIVMHVPNLGKVRIRQVYKRLTFGLEEA